MPRWLLILLCSALVLSVLGSILIVARSPGPPVSPATQGAAPNPGTGGDADRQQAPVPRAGGGGAQ